MKQKAVTRILERFKSWLAKQRSFLFSRYTKDSQETQEPERSLLELPPEEKKKLLDAVENLPSNPTDQKAIAEAIDQAFTRWQEDPSNEDNSIVILSSPVTAVSRILAETLEDWTQQKQLSLKLLPVTARPDEIVSIKAKLEHYLQSPASDASQQPEVIVIPNLNWCFLRSLEGLEGIEYLQSLLYDSSKNRFWIIGAGQVGWEYLECVCALEAYCGEVFTVPAIAPRDLQSWLAPVIEESGIVFGTPRIDKQLLDEDKDNQTSYFEHLADISQGISTVAVQGLLKSVRYQEVDNKDNQDDTRSETKKLVTQTPKLPKLPSLESADLYLLYSLLLHGDLTIAALAESLGDSESEVQARVQLLRPQGLVQQRNKVLKINPIYYPRTKQELASNNFIVNRE